MLKLSFNTLIDQYKNIVESELRTLYLNGPENKKSQSMKDILINKIVEKSIIYLSEL